MSLFFTYLMYNLLFERDHIGLDYITCFQVKYVSQLRTGNSSQHFPLINIAASLPSAISKRP